MLHSSRLKKIHRIALVGHDNEGSARLLESVVAAFPECQFLLVKCKGLYYQKSFVCSVWKLLKEASWIFIFIRFIELIKHKLVGKTLSNIARINKMPIIHTHDINSAESLAEIAAFKPDLLVSLFTMQIYRAAVINIPTYGAITSHPSILPNYRGLEVFFWVLANEEKETGVSVFFLSEKIDAGRVVWQEKVQISKETTVASLYRQITEIGGRGLVAVIRTIDNGSTIAIPQVGTGSYFSMPDRASVRRFLKVGRKFF